MRKSGNGRPEVCATNILSTIRGEVAYERIKGVDGRLHDQPMNTAAGEAQTDAERQLEIFEPRIDVDHIEVTSNEHGDFTYDIQLSRKEGEK